MYTHAITLIMKPQRGHLEIRRGMPFTAPYVDTKQSVWSLSVYLERRTEKVTTVMVDDEGEGSTFIVYDSIYFGGIV